MWIGPFAIDRWRLIHEKRGGRECHTLATLAADGVSFVQFKNSADRYGVVAQALHWTIVALIVTQFVLAIQAEDASSILQKAKILTTHKSFGMTVFMLALIRLTWRIANPVPTPLPNAKPWQHRLANLVHWLLYALILITPLAGWLMSSARNFTVSWFGIFSFPNLIAPDEDRVDLLRNLHVVLAFSILNLAILHILAALKHHFFDKDNILRRMLPLKLK
jgi:cytochrome b561